MKLNLPNNYCCLRRLISFFVLVLLLFTLSRGQISGTHLMSQELFGTPEHTMVYIYIFCFKRPNVSAVTDIMQAISFIRICRRYILQLRRDSVWCVRLHELMRSKVSAKRECMLRDSECRILSQRFDSRPCEIVFTDTNLLFPIKNAKTLMRDPSRDINVSGFDSTHQYVFMVPTRKGIDWNKERQTRDPLEMKYVLRGRASWLTGRWRYGKSLRPIILS